MKFRIISQCHQKMASNIDRGEFDFYLEEDRWDDFGFHTLYHLHAGKKITNGNPEYLGPLNIMRKGQVEGDFYLVSKEIGNIFDSLSDNFCSLSMSVELYRALERLLPKAGSRKHMVNSLKMIFSEEDDRYFEFKDQECFKTSLLRNASMQAYGLSLGREIMLDEASSYDLAKEPLTFTLPEEKGKVNFDFSSIDARLGLSIDIPSRLIVCIGNNGAGKSTILYRLARILYATPAERAIYSVDLGWVIPSDAGFRRLFIISYSAFDNFILPGVGTKDYEVILDGLKNREGRFVYCGIRDVISEYEEKIQPETDSENPFPLNGLPIRGSDIDHEKFHLLKTVDNLADETIKALNSIAWNDDKLKLWNRLMTECERANSSFNEMALTPHSYLTGGIITAEKFKHLSTGIKYLLHSLSQIIDRIEPNSLIIFDEPENHIQPPLLCKFLYCLRIISRHYRSLVLVATHSPVIVQETLAKNVIIVNREDDKWTFRNPSIETYGENIGNITDEVFNLNTSVTNYQKTATILFNQYYKESEGSGDPLLFLNLIANETGLQFGNEMKAYLISKYIENQD